MPPFYNNCNLTLDVNVICDIYRCQKGARGATRNLDSSQCLFFHPHWQRLFCDHLLRCYISPTVLCAAYVHHEHRAAAKAGLARRNRPRHVSIHIYGESIVVGHRLKLDLGAFTSNVLRL